MPIKAQRETGSFWVSKHTESSKRMPEIASICVALGCVVQASGCAEILFRQCVLCVFSRGNVFSHCSLTLDNGESQTQNKTRFKKKRKKKAFSEPALHSMKLHDFSQTKFVHLKA